VYGLAIEFDWLTAAALTGAFYGPVAAWQAAERPAEPWGQVSWRVRALVITALMGSVAVLIVLVVIDRPLLAALLAASSLVSYLLARYRRSRDQDLRDRQD
jgi:hypothetical protein